MVQAARGAVGLRQLDVTVVSYQALISQQVELCGLEFETAPMRYLPIYLKLILVAPWLVAQAFHLVEL